VNQKTIKEAEKLINKCKFCFESTRHTTSFRGICQPTVRDSMAPQTDHTVEIECEPGGAEAAAPKNVKMVSH
jgi:hypothetical protein